MALSNGRVSNPLVLNARRNTGVPLLLNVQLLVSSARAFAKSVLRSADPWFDELTTNEERPSARPELVEALSAHFEKALALPAAPLCGDGN